MLKNDPLKNVLYINLSRNSFHIEDRSDLFEERLGGVGVGIKLLLEECPKDCNPLSPENPIIFAIGPLNALFPVASKTTVLFKSPHTGNLGESHCGGRSAIAMRLAGYGAIVIKGKSGSPVYIAIHEDGVHFRDASSLWGMKSSFTVGRVIREREKGEGLRTIMRIGRAGEKLVTYAGVITESYRHFGRLGLGAVFGSKNLKAIIISGKKSLPVENAKLYRKVYNHIFNEATRSKAMKKYHDLGTQSNINPLAKKGALPVRNLQQIGLDEMKKISGESFAEHFLGRRLACSHCPVGCIHLAALREPYEDEPYFYKTSMISYDYEPTYALGTMLGISDIPVFLKLMDEVEVLSIDAMSTGVVLAWATEAYEKKLIGKRETMCLEPKWGDGETYVKMVRKIVNQPNEFYKALAKGVDYASNIYGGREFALAFGGNEMPGYHTGHGCYLGFLIGARHGHLDNAGYSIDEKAYEKKEEIEPEDMVDRLVKEEKWRQILSSLVVCFFARRIYVPDVVISALKVAGFDLSNDELRNISNEIYKDKFNFKIREGFSVDDLRLPKRILQTPSSLGTLKKEYFSKALNYFKKILFELK